jgi:CO/xanthine dehydrogenase Mo-binding subunit/aerobic-type carbon monoxide dehydrogenase small subunit (CoxS/CutS family)
MAVTVAVNGVGHRVTAEPETPLLWVLRGEVGDRSVKYGCGSGRCGSCRVLLDGRPAWSCTLAVGDADGRSVTTPAGLGDDPAGAAVQRALLDHNAGQCGYCLPGIAVTLTDLVRRGAAPDTSGVRAALDDHLCRCGAHPRILRAALDAVASAGGRAVAGAGPGIGRHPSAEPPGTPPPSGAVVEVRPPSRARRLGSLAQVPELDRWVRIAPPDRVEVRTGKVELGQGILTAVAAVAADELGVDPARIDVVSGITGTTPNEWITAGSGSVEQTVTAVRQACAHARRALVERAATRLGVAVGDLVVDDGRVSAPGGAEASYWELAGGRPFGITIEEPVEGVPAAGRRWTGRGLPRLDLAAKLRGEPVFLHDMVLPGMRHARVVRPPRPGARLAGAVPATVAGADVVRNGSFLAVVADREAGAVLAAAALASLARWDGGEDLAPRAATVDHLRDQPASSTAAVVDGSAVEGPIGPAPRHDGSVRLRASYTRPYLLHAAIGPSTAIARFEGGRLEVWSHSQGVELLRLALAEVLRLDAADVTVTHVQGAGCYGHNGADDVALDAALVALADPGRPVSVTWSRADEHAWEPAAPAMAVTLEASVDDAGAIRSWQHDVRTYSHIGRPRPTGGGGSWLLASWDLDSPWDRPAPPPGRGFHAAGYRNADPLYRVGEKRVVEHFVADSPLRTSSTRSLGAFANVFALESFVDELAAASGRDPVAFRRDHLDDPRARAVIDAVVELSGGLDAPGGIDAPGRGLAFARYENVKAYAAVVAEVTVDARTGLVVVERGWIAADAGEVIDPDGLVNQLEGGFVQAASWTLKEQVEPAEGGPGGGRPADWDGYPILRFGESPELTTRLLDRPAGRPLGAGEATTGPTAAAIANAVHQATGARIRDLPLRPARVRAALSDLL